MPIIKKNIALEKINFQRTLASKITDIRLKTVGKVLMLILLISLLVACQKKQSSLQVQQVNLMTKQAKLFPCLEQKKSSYHNANQLNCAAWQTITGPYWQHQK